MRARMRKALTSIAFGAALFFSSEAHAQFANKRIGLELGVYRFSDNDITLGLPLVLEGSFYIENGFEVGLRVPLTLYLTRFGNQQYFGLGANVFIRYLFSEETLRPWIGGEVDFSYIFRDENSDMTGNQRYFFGPGAAAGLDWFISDTVSIGPRAFFTLNLALNSKTAVVRPTYGGTFNAFAYF